MKKTLKIEKMKLFTRSKNRVRIESRKQFRKQRRKDTKMIKYKIDIVKSLKEKGYTATYIKQGNLLPSQTIQNIKSGKSITLDTLNKICIMLRCQPGDLIECYITDEEKIKYFR